MQGALCLTGIILNFLFRPVTLPGIRDFACRNYALFFFFFFFLVGVSKYYLILIPPSASIKQVQTGQCCILTKKFQCTLKFCLRALKILVPVTDFAAIKRSGISPIHCAAAGAHPKCLELLIQAGFDVNFMLDQRIRKHYDDHRKSALYFAVSNGDVSSVKLLLSAGALPNQDPVNCLQIALRMGNYELVSLLLRHGANVNYFCRVNPLHFPSALQYTLKDEVMLRMLLNYGYDTERCFDCPHGDKAHPFYAFEGWTSTVIKDTMVSTTTAAVTRVVTIGGPELQQQIQFHSSQKLWLERF